MDIAKQRLYAQRIEGEKFTTALEVVKHMGAMQAQDFGQAVWAVGLRMKNPSLAAVEKAIADREIILTWPMRGTIHFVPAEDAKWMVQLMAPQAIKAAESRRRQLEISDETVEKTGDAFTTGLQGGKQLTRPALMQLLVDAGIDTSEQRGYHLLRHFAQKGLLCLASPEGKKQTFALMDEWVKSSKSLSRSEALAEITLRYFVSHGPATLKDFAGWTGLAAVDVKQGLEYAKAYLISEVIDGKEFWFAAGLPKSDASNVHLLPGFDEYFLGYKDRSHIVNSLHATKVVPGNNGVFKPMIVQNGQVVGTWKRVIGKSNVALSYDFFENVVTADTLATEAKRYARFINLPLR